MRGRIAPAEAWHVPWVAARMRAADRDEVAAWSGLDPLPALAASLDRSALAWAGLLDDEPVCLFGVGGDVLGPVGVPWLLGTERIDAVPVTFLRLSRVALGLIRSAYPVLSNWTDARHARAHAWLEWLGFRLGDARPMGVAGLPFRPFGMGGDHV